MQVSVVQPHHLRFLSVDLEPCPLTVLGCTLLIIGSYYIFIIISLLLHLYYYIFIILFMA